MSAQPAARRRAARPIALAALRGFESAARHLSFTLAAAELNLTQSSISRQIASLERQIGKPLFVRRTRALELTPAGERLYATVRQGIGAIDRCIDEIRGVGGPPRVTVATYASFASLWLVPRLAAFQKAHPQVEIRIDAADRPVDLEAEEIDLAIRWLRPGSSVDPSALLLCEEEVAPALSPRLIESSGAVPRRRSARAAAAGDGRRPADRVIQQLGAMVRIRRGRAGPAACGAAVLHLRRPGRAGGRAWSGRRAGAHAFP
jgi:DNA-binding transcriptional LysR family regulator